MDVAVLDSPVLELNKSWQPIHVIDVRRAFSMMMAGLAKAVEPESYQLHAFETWADLRAAEGEPCVRTVSLSLRLPEVIVLNRYDRIPSRKVVFSRRNIYRRDGYTCQYCGTKPGSEELSIDHVLPKSKGGRSEWSNCVVACTPCNARKASRTARQAGLRLKRQPVAPVWKPSLAIGRFRIKASWEKFVSAAYWETELESS